MSAKGNEKCEELFDDGTGSSVLKTGAGPRDCGLCCCEKCKKGREALKGANCFGQQQRQQREKKTGEKKQEKIHPEEI